jgi:hypothetical protein
MCKIATPELKRAGAAMKSAENSFFAAHHPIPSPRLSGEFPKAFARRLVLEKNPDYDYENDDENDSLSPKQPFQERVG